MRAEVADCLARTPVRFAIKRLRGSSSFLRTVPSGFGSPASCPLASILPIYEETTTIIFNYLIGRFGAQVFFDVGAGVGYLSRVAASHARVDTRAHAFEMRPDRLRELLCNISSDSFADRITVHPAGVTDRHQGEVEIWYARGMLFEHRPDPVEYRETWWRRLKFALRAIRAGRSRAREP